MDTPEVRTSRARIILLSLLSILCLFWLIALRRSWSREMTFDDAYMFYRYALHIRHGYGISWNAGHGHTYGPTSLGWTFVVTVLSVIPLAPGKLLLLASWLSGLGALFSIAWASSVYSVEPWFRSTWRSAAILGVPLLGCLPLMGTSFRLNSENGMDTMLGVALNALTCGFILRWTRRPTYRSAAIAGSVGFLAVFTRPDSGLPIFLLVLLACWLLVEVPAQRRTVAVLLLIFFGAIVFDVAICKLYFHTPVPLSFYMKAHKGYDGYIDNWASAVFVAQFFSDYALFVLLIILLASGRRAVSFAAAFLIPLVFSFSYYTFFVLQIMGQHSRYYLPLLPFLVVPAVFVTDRSLPDKQGRTHAFMGARIAALLVFALLLAHKDDLQAALEQRRGVKAAFTPPDVTVVAENPLPDLPWFDTQKILADEVVAKLPAGASIACSEVGYLGAVSPQVEIIDLSGLNDYDIALNGFSAKGVFARKPDLIWFPVPVYTSMYGRLYAAPELLQDYTMLQGALKYGLAIRKGSPYRTQIEKSLAKIWPVLYPGYPMDDYRVQSVRWDPNKHPVTWNGVQYNF